MKMTLRLCFAAVLIHPVAAGSTGKSFYNILEVPEDADTATIKKSYRKLAMQYHPDKNPDDEAAAEKFKEIAEAHEILSDPEKKRLYDDNELHGGPHQGGGPQGGGFGGGGDPFGAGGPFGPGGPFGFAFNFGGAFRQNTQQQEYPGIQVRNFDAVLREEANSILLIHVYGAFRSFHGEWMHKLFASAGESIRDQPLSTPSFKLLHVDIFRNGQHELLNQLRRYPALLFYYKGKKIEFVDEVRETRPPPRNPWAAPQQRPPADLPLEQRLLRFAAERVVRLADFLYPITRVGGAAPSPTSSWFDYTWVATASYRAKSLRFLQGYKPGGSTALRVVFVLPQALSLSVYAFAAREGAKYLCGYVHPPFVGTTTGSGGASSSFFEEGLFAPLLDFLDGVGLLGVLPWSWLLATSVPGASGGTTSIARAINAPRGGEAGYGKVVRALANAGARTSVPRPGAVFVFDPLSARPDVAVKALQLPFESRGVRTSSGSGSGADLDVAKLHKNLGPVVKDRPVVGLDEASAHFAARGDWFLAVPAEVFAAVEVVATSGVSGSGTGLSSTHEESDHGHRAARREQVIAVCRSLRSRGKIKRCVLLEAGGGASNLSRVPQPDEVFPMRAEGKGNAFALFEPPAVRTTGEGSGSASPSQPSRLQQCVAFLEELQTKESAGQLHQTREQKMVSTTSAYYTPGPRVGTVEPPPSVYHPRYWAYRAARFIGDQADYAQELDPAKLFALLQALVLLILFLAPVWQTQGQGMRVGGGEEGGPEPTGRSTSSSARSEKGHPANASSRMTGKPPAETAGDATNGNGTKCESAAAPPATPSSTASSQQSQQPAGLRARNQAVPAQIEVSERIDSISALETALSSSSSTARAGGASSSSIVIVGSGLFRARHLHAMRRVSGDGRTRCAELTPGFWSGLAEGTISNEAAATAAHRFRESKDRDFILVAVPKKARSCTVKSLDDLERTLDKISDGDFRNMKTYATTAQALLTCLQLV